MSNCSLASSLITCATVGTGQFTLGKFVDNFDAPQIGWQRLALAVTRSRGDEIFVGVADQIHRLTLGLVEQRQLRCVGFDGLLGSTTEQTVAQQLNLFFQVKDMDFVSLTYFLLTSQRVERIKQHSLEKKGKSHCASSKGLSLGYGGDSEKQKARGRTPRL